MEVYEKVDSVASLLNIKLSTFKKYYGEFEKHGYRFQRSSEGHVLFSEHDIEMIREFVDIKNHPSMTLQKAVKEVLIKEGILDITDTTYTNSDIALMAKQVETASEDMRLLKELIQQQTEMMMQFQQAQIATAAAHVEENRQERMTDMITRRRVESQLRKEALQEWSKKPDEERKIRTGLFRKEENINKRDIFIEDYIGEHIEERIKREYDLQ